MERRIFGIETEYGITCVAGGQRTLTPDEVARYLFRKVVSWGRSSNVFLQNGSRLYLDVGSHPEYATPECDDVGDLVVHDKAGERIVGDLVRDAQERLTEEGLEGTIYVFKNNTDSAGNSYGCHENYLLSRAGDFQDVSDTLLPFLVSRQIICGAGKVVAGARGARYAVSQRAEHIWEGVSSATTRSRPIINTRDEPHADAERYRRLHVIVGDSNMSETTTLLKVGSADLVLRMIEAGVVIRDLTLENPIRSIREMSYDITGRRTVRLANGRELSALDLQRTYVEAATAFAQREGLLEHPVHRRVLDLWTRTVQAVESQDLTGIETEIDWAIKRRLLLRYADKHGLELNDARIAQLDLAYHDIDPARGLFSVAQRSGLVARVTDDTAVEQAMTTPPQTTRAKLRGDFVRAAQEHRRDFTVDWVHLKLNDQAQRTVLCKNPFTAVDARVERLIEGMRAGTGNAQPATPV
jgi:proteasome accessory factor A